MTKENKKIEKKEVKETPKKTGGKKKRKKQETPLRNPDIYEKYKLWKSLPTMWKGMKRGDLIEKFGIEDEDMLDLLECKTQGEFAKKYGLDISTTTDWNHRMNDEGIDYLSDIKKWANKLTKNVTLAHYNKLIRKFDPVSADIWYKVMADFNEKKQIEHSGKLSLADLARQLADEEEKTNKHNK